MDAVVCAINEQLCKDCRPLGMHCRVGDPVLLGYCGWRVDHKLISMFVEGGRSLHLYCVVACMGPCNCVRWELEVDEEVKHGVT